jgi:hypothetical protein
MNCTRRYFELDKEASERVKRYQCLVCQKLIISRKDLYFICTSDEDNIVKHLMEINNDTRMCESEDCFFDTDNPNEMKEHIKTCSSYITKCKYHISGCKYVNKKEELIEHETQCLYKIKKCLLCHKNIIYKDIYNHIVKYHYISNSSISYQDFIIDTSEMNFSSYMGSSAYPFACVSSATTTTPSYTIASNYTAISNILNTLGNLDTMSLQYDYQPIFNDNLTLFINEMFSNSSANI